jgi:hypothetical protein
MTEFNQFLEKQNGIYAKFEAANAQIGETEGVKPDTGGLAKQARFIIALRYPEKVGLLVEEFSAEVADAVGAATYGPHNAHSTLSDLKPDEGVVEINLGSIPEDEELILDTLARATREAIDQGLEFLPDSEVRFDNHLTNGSTVVAPGQPNEDVWKLKQLILEQTKKGGIDLGSGAWGFHMTESRFKEAHNVDSPEVARLVRIIEAAGSLGVAKPTAVDVGYFNTNPEDGFVLTTYERFDLSPRNF